MQRYSNNLTSKNLSDIPGNLLYGVLNIIHELHSMLGVCTIFVQRLLGEKADMKVNNDANNSNINHCLFAVVFLSTAVLPR